MLVPQCHPDAGEDDYGSDEVGLAGKSRQAHWHHVEHAWPMGERVDDQQIVESGQHRETEPRRDQHSTGGS